MPYLLQRDLLNFKLGANESSPFGNDSISFHLGHQQGFVSMDIINGECT
jgi:hypothetical protein